jgi:hypothetical protein
MWLSPSSEASSYGDTQETLVIVLNSKFHYRVHKRKPLIPIISQVKCSPDTFYFFKILLNIVT